MYKTENRNAIAMKADKITVGVAAAARWWWSLMNDVEKRGHASISRIG